MGGDEVDWEGVIVAGAIELNEGGHDGRWPDNVTGDNMELWDRGEGESHGNNRGERAKVEPDEFVTGDVIDGGIEEGE